MERIRYWKCSDCHGTGRAEHIPGRVTTCERCDGTGNALVDGEAAAHRRRLIEIDADKASQRFAVQYDDEVTAEQIAKIDRLVAPEFETGDWVTVESETAR